MQTAGRVLMRSLWLGWLVGLPGCTGIPRQEANWTPLFNGQDLSGWTVRCRPADQGKTFWRVDQGSILCDSMGRKDHHYVWLMTDREYGDFELRLRHFALQLHSGDELRIRIKDIEIRESEVD